jgi:hypothetical protein
VAIAAAEGFFYQGSVFGLHSLGLKANTGYICVSGANYVGQLGDNTTTAKSVFSCSVGPVISTEEYDSKAVPGIVLYPNPAHDILHVSLPSNGVIQNNHIRLYDQKGSLVHTAEIHADDHISIHVGHLPKGLYFITINRGGELYKDKVVIK